MYLFNFIIGDILRWWCRLFLRGSIDGTDFFLRRGGEIFWFSFGYFLVFMFY